MSIRVDSAVLRHSWITFGPQLTLDDSVGYPPMPEQQATSFEDNLAPRRHSSCHDSDSLTGERTVMPLTACSCRDEHAPA
ncbi:hypothetical protein Psi02_27110 [Planotetraspora silvatica]|uniref:Uncharacterized protein n=1 Tax=Planotetraspora silvatica TaxID=234614 RepID=A0A8J3UM60_9ACTN|nr:hypothetical protein Psi02_27110 [Planotetraspora silvatica]